MSSQFAHARQRALCESAAVPRCNRPVGKFRQVSHRRSAGSPVRRRVAQSGEMKEAAMPDFAVAPRSALKLSSAAALGAAAAAWLAAHALAASGPHFADADDFATVQ